MNPLIVDARGANRHVLQRMLGRFGPCEMAADGAQAIAALTRALDEGRPFGLVCLDIMMPGMDGQQALAAIRALEAGRGIHNGKRVKIFMVTAVQDASAVTSSRSEEHTSELQ